MLRIERCWCWWWWYNKNIFFQKWIDKDIIQVLCEFQKFQLLKIPMTMIMMMMIDEDNYRWVCWGYFQFELRWSTTISIMMTDRYKQQQTNNIGLTMCVCVCFFECFKEPKKRIEIENQNNDYDELMFWTEKKNKSRKLLIKQDQQRKKKKEECKKMMKIFREKNMNFFNKKN